MKLLINQECTRLVQGHGYTEMLKQIERAARVCYQSDNLIKTDSAQKILKHLIDNKHYAMLEHGTVYMKIPMKDWVNGMKEKFVDNVDVVKYIRYEIYDDDDNVYLTTNYRVIFENGLEFWMGNFMSPEVKGKHIPRVTYKLLTNIQVATEYIRHRVFSFAMESTRYCSYDKEKFGDEITFLIPCWLLKEDTPETKQAFIEWSNAMQDAENHYMRSRQMGWVAQECAQYLPKATKTTLVMTGFRDDWDHFIDLRYWGTTGKPHPQAQELATLVFEDLNKFDEEHDYKHNK